MRKRIRSLWRQLVGVRRTPDEVADLIEGFLDGTGDDWDLDDLTSVPIADPRLNQIRSELLRIENRCPGGADGHLSVEGVAKLRAIVRRLRGQASETDYSAGPDRG